MIPRGVSWFATRLPMMEWYGKNRILASLITTATQHQIVLVGNGGRSVNYGRRSLWTSDSDTEKRYKMAYWDFVNVAGRQVPGLCVAFSRDGIHGLNIQKRHFYRELTVIPLSLHCPLKVRVSRPPVRQSAM
ncbi:MAG: hypothetical protein CM1200mP29_11950 [Verrucomicrobiota bacterium]|nr:MAG: hypothetical protein CM1200mP29_11950 [Verrucomicrobiota bacterium]